MESFFTRYRNLLVLLALLVAQIIGLAMQVRRSASGRVTYDPADSSGVRLIRLWANAIVSPPEKAVEHSKTGAGSIWFNYFDLRHVRQENKDLQDEIDRLRLEQASLLEDARQGQRLQALLNFREKYVYKTTPAQVIGTSGSNLSRVFYIDKGKDDGIVRDMAVITPDGIVGKVREAYAHTAQVLAINDQSSGAGVILEKERIRGILRGNAAGQPQIVGILADQRIQPGEKVLTAGGDEIFPRGLPVGVVQKVVKDPEQDGFIDVIVTPAVNLDRLDEVLIITATESQLSDQQQKDLATSQQLKGGDVTALDDQHRASEILAERLPGLTDPNAPKPATPQTPGANGQAPNPPTVPLPKILPPQHPDRFTPGYNGNTLVPTGPGETIKPTAEPGTSGAKPGTPKKENAPKSGNNVNQPAPKPKSNPQPQEKP